jgi:hypothetical protein
LHYIHREYFKILNSAHAIRRQLLKKVCLKFGIGEGKMKKYYFMGFLVVLIFLSAGNPRAGLASPTTIPAITFQVHGTFTGYSGEWTRLGELIAFNVPFPVRAAISAQVQGGPPDMVFGVYFFPAGPCPEGLVWAAGHCYPTDIMASTIEYTINERTLQVMGQAWKARPMFKSASNGQFTLSGQITVTFMRILTLPEVKFIKVTSPAANTVFQAGSNINIAWTSMGAVGVSVKIRLVPEAEPQAAQVIAASTPNDGAHTWIPATGFPGRVWLEVQSLDGKITGKSGLFTINH